MKIYKTVSSLLFAAGLLFLAGSGYAQTNTPQKIPALLQKLRLTITPFVSVAPSPVLSPQPEIRMCTEHDLAVYHGLRNKKDGCWYDHEHGDDPGSINDIFGEVGEWWGGSQSISYPWQTFMFAGIASGGGENFPEQTGLFENEMKHQGYKWHVRENLPCDSDFSGGCIRSIRTQDHVIGSALDAVIRFHSFSTEMLVCPKSAPENCGIVRTGGWQDKGILSIDGQLFPEYGPQNGGARLHHYQIGNPHFATWYGGTLKATTVTQVEDMWGLVLPEDPTELNLFCPEDPANCGYNNSKRELHLAGAALQGKELRWLRDNGYVGSNNRINFVGYTDRYGTIIKDSSCRAAQLDCVPLIMVNYDPSVTYQYRGDAKEYDTSAGVLSESPIRYPN